MSRRRAQVELTEWLNRHCLEVSKLDLCASLLGAAVYLARGQTAMTLEDFIERVQGVWSVCPESVSNVTQH